MRRHSEVINILYDRSQQSRWTYIVITQFVFCEDNISEGNHKHSNAKALSGIRSIVLKKQSVVQKKFARK